MYKKARHYVSLNKHVGVPSCVPRCYSALPELMLGSNGTQTKYIYIFPSPHCLPSSILCNHTSISFWYPATSLSHWIIYPTFLLLHHSFTAPLLSNHTLICQSERCFLRSARGKTSTSDGSHWGLLHVVLSPVREQGGVGQGEQQGLSRFDSGSAGWGGVGEGGRGGVSVCDCSFWYPLSHSSK